MKRTISVLLIVVLAAAFAMVFAACDGGGNDMPVEEGAEVITVYLRDFEDWSNNYTISAIKRFNSILDDGIQVEYLLLDDSVYENKVQSERENGNAPDVYLISYGNLWAQIQSPYNYLLQLDDVLSQKMIDDISDNAKKYVTFNGKLYAAPFCFEPSIMLYYSKSMFEKAGISEAPTTYSEMLDACAKLSQVVEKKKGQTVVGTPLGLARGWANVGQFYNVTGGHLPITDDWSTCIVNDYADDYATFLNYWSALYKNGYASVADIAGGYNEIIRELCEGRVAMTFAGSYAVSTIMEEYPETADDIGLVAVPTAIGSDELGATVNGGWSYVMDADTANRKGSDGRTHAELAAVFLEYLLTDPDVAPEYFEKAYYSKFAGYDSVIAENEKNVSVDNKYYSVIVDVAQKGISMPIYSWDITNACSAMIEEVVLDEKTVEKAIADCHSKIARIISNQGLSGKNPTYSASGD